jgi:hypothetical protein
VPYEAGKWTVTKKEEAALIIFERKIFRRIYGPKNENGEWKSRTNRELEEISTCKYRCLNCASLVSKDVWTAHHL